jgi:hypothetical protein
MPGSEHTRLRVLARSYGPAALAAAPSSPNIVACAALRARRSIWTPDTSLLAVLPASGAGVPQIAICPGPNTPVYGC